MEEAENVTAPQKGAADKDYSADSNHNGAEGVSLLLHGRLWARLAISLLRLAVALLTVRMRLAVALLRWLTIGRRLTVALLRWLTVGGRLAVALLRRLTVLWGGRLLSVRLRQGVAGKVVLLRGRRSCRRRRLAIVYRIAIEIVL